ncbi:MAG: DUF932 domain-containing protein [Pseudomonadota bacterium]|nr:DUF932 domain-containing protein [Pseudomonadota bacterium]MEC8316452.1 DUF932 domain-containing protein [Pseudomonadota bacterium]
MLQNLDNAHSSLANLAQTVMTRKAQKEDLLVNTQGLFYTADADTKKPLVIVEGQGGEPTRTLKVNDVAFTDIAGKANIDVRTARRLQEGYTDQYTALINAIWQKEPSNRMTRSFMHDDRNGVLRAWLSDSYKVYDNEDFLEAVLPVLAESDAQWEVQNAVVTDHKLYARFRSRVIQGEGANVGDLMALGVGISNSEVGRGAVDMYQMTWTLACLNGMQTQNRQKSAHIGSAKGDSELMKILSPEAKQADSHATSLKLRDVAASFASRESFENVLQKMRGASDDVLEGTYQVGAVKKLTQVLKLPQKREESILEGLFKKCGQNGYAGQPISRATMLNAVTACAHNADADSVDDWQAAGGRVLNMSRADWSAVSAASVAA